jgi:formate/nitrite transporter FocA (FNT family)
MDEYEKEQHQLTQPGELDGVDLSPDEQREVEERSRPRAEIIHEAIRIEGGKELRRPTKALAWSGLAAGLAMGFSLVAEGSLQASLPDTNWRPLLTELGYSVGFIIVIFGRQQLFTENTLTAILPLLSNRTVNNLRRVARLWITVLLSNLVGAWLFVQVIGHSDIFSPPVRQAFTEIGLKAAAGEFWTIFIQGILAGWLIALMVWLLPAAETARFWVVVVITYLVGLGHLAHSIAGSVEVLYVVVTGTVSWGDYLGGYLLPALLGNIVGGVGLVAILNYAQIASKD